MSRFDITNPNQRNSRLAQPSLSEEIPDFIPVTADAPMEVAAPAADPQKNAALPEQPKAEVEAPAPVDAEVSPKKRGRPAKSAGGPAGKRKPSAKGARAKDNVEDGAQKKQVAFYITKANYQRIRLHCLTEDCSFTDFMEELSLGAIDNGYRCKEADCNTEFTVLSTLRDTAPFCPCCGSKRTERLSEY